MALEDTTFSLPPCSFSTEKKPRKQKQNNNKTFFTNEKQPLGKTQLQRLEITLSSSSATLPTRFFVFHSLLRSQKGELFTGQLYATDAEFYFLVLQRTFSLPGFHLTLTHLKQDHSRAPALSAGSAMEGAVGLKVCSSNKLLANPDASEQTPCSETSDLSHNFSDRTPDSAHEC